MTPEDRAWEVVRRAFEERTPAPRRRGRLALALVPAVAAAVAVAALSPPGHAVFQRVREAVGVEHAANELGTLPARGRLLVVARGRGGAWLVDSSGLRRSLGAYDDVQWSPHGLFVVATRPDELVALDPQGKVRWVLPATHPELPRWEGTRTDTRIAYLAAGGLRVVAGDGTGDRVLDAHAARVAPAWDPARLHTVAYVAGSYVLLRRADGTLVWRSRPGVVPTALAWSSDGRFLAVSSARRIAVLDARGRLVHTVSLLSAKRISAAFEPGTHRLAVSIRLARRSEIRLVDLDRLGPEPLLFAGPGVFGDVAWSPDGTWLLVPWPTANQWLFVHGTHVRAVGNIRAQFGPAAQLGGRWCCSRSG
jgi:hypothetical protein